MASVPGKLGAWIHELGGSAPGSDTGPLAWDAFAALCDETQERLGGREALRAASQAFAAARLQADPSRGSARLALAFACRMLGPALLPDLDWSLREEDDGRLQLELRLQPGLRPCAPLFALLEGALAAAPCTVGAAPARLRGAAGDASARYEILDVPPAGPGDERSELLERVARATPDVLFVFDLERGAMRFLTDGGLTCLGLPREFLAQQDRAGLDAFIHPDDLPEIARHRLRALALPPGGVAQAEARVRHEDGSWRWLRFRDVVFSRAADGSAREMLVCVSDVTGQRVAERARQLGDQRLRAIAESAWDVIVELGPDTRASYVSPNATVLLGWPVPELRRLRREDFLHPDDLARVEEHVDKLLRAGEPQRMSFRVRHQDGSWRHVEMTATPFLGADGERRGICVGRDATERLRTEQERERLASLVSASSELVAIFEPDGRLQFLNRAGRRLAGWGGAALRGRSLFDLLDPAEATRLRQEAFDAALHGAGWEGECRLRPAEGDEPVDVLATVFRLPDPRIAESRSLAMVARDIRGRKRAETALHESEQRFRMLVENGFDLIAEIDADGRFLYASPRYGDVLGYDPERLRGEPALDLVHPDDRASISAMVDSLAERPETRLGPLRVRDRDGAWRRFECHVRPYRRGNGQAVLVVVSREAPAPGETRGPASDPGPQRIDGSKLEAVGRLAGGIAHDFNNLLTAVTGYADLIHQELGAGDPLREDAREILRAAEQASILTRQLLAFSSRQLLQPQVVDANAFLRDRSELLRGVLGRGIEIETLLDSDAGVVRVDPAQLEQLLVNLVTNAREAMPEGGTLLIASARLELVEGMPGHPGVPAGSWLWLRVADTGVGMDAERLERVFEPFFTTREGGRGAGLGLASVYGIARQSGGHIRAESRRGEGSTFHLYLPRSEASAPQRIERLLREELRGDETIVLVEDEGSVRRLLRRYLQEHGYTVIDAPGANEALAAVRRHEGPIDLLVTDVVMPGMDGPSLAARLESEHPGLRVLYISGLANQELVRRGVPTDAASLLQKPFSPPELLRRLRARLGPRARAGTE